MPGEKPTKEGLLYDFYFDETSRVGQRTDFFLIFHAILLEAFFGATHEMPRADVGILRCLTAYLWFMTGYRQRWILRHLGECMGQEELVGPDVSRLFPRIFEARRKGLHVLVRWAQPVPTFAIVIPLTFTVAWLVLLIVESSRKWRWLCPAAGGVAIIVSTVVAARLCRGPIISKPFIVAPSGGGDS